MGRTSREKESEITPLLTAAWDSESWSEPELVAEDADLLVNWADFPGLAFHDDGTVAAQWLVKQGEHAYAYEAWVGFRQSSATRAFQTAVTVDPSTETSGPF